MASVLLAGALLAAGCTGDDGPRASADPGAGTTQPEAAPAAVLAEGGAPVTVAGGKSAGQVSAAVSKALFTSAPAVVVALATDPAAVRSGAEQAGRLGVPLLLDDGGKYVGAATAELARLKPDTVLALGAGVAERVGGSAKVVTDAGQLPALAKPTAPAGTVVLVPATPGPVTTVGTATGTAAGATVLPVKNMDPRTDPAAIAALAGAKPARVVAAGAAFGPVDRLTDRLAVARTGVQLPGGGQTMLPGKRLVAMYGHPGTAGLGVLGEQPLAQAIARAKQLAAPYQPLSGRTPVVPTFEIIATVAQGSAGPDGDYSYEAPVSLLKPWVDAAGKAGVYVVLDLQPGRADFVSQAKIYEPLLTLPHVGLALDPEWRLRPDQVPLTEIGSAKAAEINATYRWLADLTEKNALPQKLFVIHQFKLSMIGSDEPLEHDRDSVQLLIHMDGQGATSLKDGTWASVVGAAPKGVPFGWKNFYDEDEPMLTPAQTMTRKPTPSMISYQ
jgi:hypothetical protein